MSTKISMCRVCISSAFQKKTSRQKFFVTISGVYYFCCLTFMVLFFVCRNLPSFTTVFFIIIRYDFLHRLLFVFWNCLQMIVRALFSFDLTMDDSIPCQEAGLSFQQGDILHIVNQDDAIWWQAYKHGDSSKRAGLIPSRHYHER